MQKWEYCMLFQRGFDFPITGNKEFWILQNGKRVKLPRDTDESIVMVLNRLGEDGWEAVNFVDNTQPLRGPEKINRVGAYNQVLLKRPIE